MYVCVEKSRKHLCVPDRYALVSFLSRYVCKEAIRVTFFTKYDIFFSKKASLHLKHWVSHK